MFTVSSFDTSYTVFNDSLTNSNSVNPKFVLSGDPVINSGWLYKYSNDFRMLISYGPFTFRKGEPQEVICAIIGGRGEDRLSSITEAKRIAGVVKEIYDNNFTDLPVGIKENKNENIPAQFTLEQNYPNPFNPSTTIKYSIPNNTVMLNSFQHLNNSEIPNQVRDDNANVKLIVYDILGREVAILVNQKQKPGNYEVELNASNFTSGVYFYRLNAGDFTQVKKMILLK
ncbi:MAG: T9SS type A sorting domain-containing protein [Ignavibacteriales bacterium]|nr:T9SS type A sorting domain-containing protein [Ignavibacteriales bacterium]